MVNCILKKNDYKSVIDITPQSDIVCHIKGII